MTKKRSYAAQKKGNQQQMKPLEEDPCPSCMYGKERLQHNVPGRVENFNRVKPTEAFGPAAKQAQGARQAKRKPKPKPNKPKPKPKPKKPKNY